MLAPCSARGDVTRLWGWRPGDTPASLWVLAEGGGPASGGPRSVTPPGSLRGGSELCPHGPSSDYTGL